MTHYISTRGKAPALSFPEVVMAGLASDGGLYVPESMPQLSPQQIASLRGLPYTELAFRVMQPFIGDSIPGNDLRKLIESAYSEFRHSAIAPLTQLNHNLWLMELFHGPTLAFKDFALQFLGRLMEYLLEKNKQDITIVGATSGDTGSAAIAGCRGRKHMRIFILHPKGRTSDVQRRQMTSVTDKNVYNIALEGSFDDCQDIVKALFMDAEFRDKHKLAAVNSINWARILAQVVYYFHAALALGAPANAVSFTVPTGNFGDIYAGYVAKCMGLPIEKLIIATNSNDILARCLKTGEYKVSGVNPSLSPSMDIQVASNFERLLFDLNGRNAKAIEALMQNLKQSRGFSLSESALSTLRRDFDAGSVDDRGTLAIIAKMHKQTGLLLDPHSAVGVGVAQDSAASTPMVVLATAHAAKFPDAVKQATCQHPPLPEYMTDLFERKERYVTLGNDISAIRSYIESAA